MNDNLNKTRQPTDETAGPDTAAGLILAATALEMADLSDVLAHTNNRFLSHKLHEFAGQIGVAMELLGLFPHCAMCPKKNTCHESKERHG